MRCKGASNPDCGHRSLGTGRIGSIEALKIRIGFSFFFWGGGGGVYSMLVVGPEGNATSNCSDRYRSFRQ